jgi:predicted phosphodiesterase
MKKFEWPETFINPFENYYLPNNLNNTLWLADTHIPFHDPYALDVAINYGITKKIDSIFLNGDIIDCYQLSVYNPDPRKRKFWEEIEAFKQFIRVLKDAFKGKEIYYKLGNHEERYYKIMIQRAPFFLDVPGFDFENIMGCDELGVKIIKDQRIVYIGKFPVLHGHEVKLKSAVVNPARSLFLKTYRTCGMSHLHKTSQHSEQAMDGKTINTYSTGHLSDPHPEYARLNKWNHGIARVETDAEGNFVVINFPLVHNKLFGL